MASPNTPSVDELVRADTIKKAANAYAIAAEQLANKGPYLQKTYDGMRARGEDMASELVMGRDTLRAEAKAVREAAANVKDLDGVRGLSSRLDRLDKSMQATTEQMGRQNPDLLKEKQSMGLFGGSRTVEKTADEVLRASLAPDLERGRYALARAQKDLAPEQSKTNAQPQLAHRYRNDFKMVEGAEKMAVALSKSEKLTKDERTHYADLAKKLHSTGEAIHDKASARHARQEAMAGAKHMMADAKRVGEKAPELQAGRKEYAAAVKVHEKPKVQLADATKKADLASISLNEAKAAVREASSKQDRIGVLVQEATKAVETKAAALEPLAQAQQKAEDTLKVAQLESLRAQDAVKKAEEKLAGVQKENKDSFLGGVFGGAKKEEDAAKALTEAKARLEKAEGTVTDVRGKAESAKEVADVARTALSGAQTEKEQLSKAFMAAGEGVQKAGEELAKAEKVRADAQAAFLKAGGKAVEPEKAKEPAKEPVKEQAKPAELKREEIPTRDAVKEVRTVDEKAAAKVASMQSVSPREQDAVRGVLATVDPNAKLNKEGVTPLMVAARLNDTATIKELLAKGADPQVKNNEGKTAFDVAGSKEVAALLRSPEKALDATKSGPAASGVSAMADVAGASKQGSSQVIKQESALNALLRSDGATSVTHSAKDGVTMTFKDGSSYTESKANRASENAQSGHSAGTGVQRVNAADEVGRSASTIGPDGRSRTEGEQQSKSLGLAEGKSVSSTAMGGSGTSMGDSKTQGHVWNPDDRVKREGQAVTDFGNSRSPATQAQDSLQQDGRRQAAFITDTPNRVIHERERG